MKMNISKYFTATFLVLATSGCMNLTLGDSAISGRVLDDATGKPIPDAIVHVVWQGNIHGIVQGSTVCYHVEAAITDGEGKFLIPSWHRPARDGERRISDKDRSLVVYNEGYGDYGPSPQLDWRGDIRIKRTVGSLEKQLDFSNRHYMFGCGSGDGSANNPALQILSSRMCAERNRISKLLGKSLETCANNNPPTPNK
jgi:hypothetical protein